jgi:hypothetical protein
MPKRRVPPEAGGGREKVSLPGKIFGSLFFLPFLAFGLWFLGLMIYGFFASARTFLWEKTDCTILSSSVEEHPDDSSEPYRFKVSYIYTVDGQRYTDDTYRFGYSGSSEIADARRLADRYPVGSQAVCYVNRDHPESAMLRHPNLWGFLALPFPLLFVAVGGVGLYTLWRPQHAGVVARVAQDRVLRHVGTRGCMVAFFSVFFLVGGGFSLFFLSPALQALKAKSWQATPCTILSSQVRTHPGDSDSGPTYDVAVLYVYTFGGREYKSNRYQFLGGSSGGYQDKERIVRRLPPLTRTTCYVNPEEPTEAVLDRSISREYAFVLVPLLFLLVGLGGIILTLRGGLGEKGS